jgi:hypothetical protein
MKRANIVTDGSLSTTVGAQLHHLWQLFCSVDGLPSWVTTCLVRFSIFFSVLFLLYSISFQTLNSSLHFKLVLKGI